MSRLFLTAGLLAVALAALLNLRGAMPPLQDFNEWAYQGWLIGEMLRGAGPPFGLKPWPVPNAAAQMLLGVLNLPLGPRAAGLTYLAAYLAAATWLAAAIARAQGPFNAPVFLLALLVGGLNSPYWDGFANSQLGVLLYLAHVLRERRGPTPVSWDLALGLALFLCHAAMLAVFALHVGIAAWQRRQPGRAALVLAPPLLLLAWYVLRDDNYGEAIPRFGTSLPGFLAYKAYTAAKLGPYRNFILGGLGDADRAPLAYAAGVAANLAFAAAILIPLAHALLSRLRQGDRSPALLTAGACLAGFAVLPSALFGVVNLGERLLVPAVLVLLACCPPPRRLAPAAAIALLAPLAVLHLHAILPAALPPGGISHLAAHDPAERLRLLFWHRPYQFHAQAAAAVRGAHVRLGFTTSVVRPLPPPQVAR